MKGTTRNISMLMGVCFLLFLVVLLLFGVWRQGIYDDSLGINLVIIGNNDSVAVMVLRPNEQIVSWINLPDNLKIKIYNSQASYPISSLWKYGVMEKNEYNIVGKSVGSSVGIVVSGVIRLDTVSTIENVLGGLHSLNLKTDLSIRDRFSIRNSISGLISSKKVLEQDIPRNAYDKIAEPDGKEFVTFNSIVNLWSKNKFIFEKISSENVDAYVVNSSGVSGAGFLLAKQLESSGMRVVDVKVDSNDNHTGSGCAYMVIGEYPITKMFLSTQMKCRALTQTDGNRDQSKGVYVWVR